MSARKAPVRLGVELWPEPVQQPADPGSADIYEVDVDVLARWQDARKDYLSARAALVGEIEPQGWRASEPAATHVDIAFRGPPGPQPMTLIDVEDEQGHSLAYGQWIERDDGYWVLRIPRG